MKIGNQEVLLSGTLFIPHGEVASVSHQIREGDILNCNFNFSLSEEVKSPSIKLEYVNNVFNFDFINFDSSLGHSTSKPINFANSNAGEQIYMLAVVQRLKTFTKFEFQFAMECNK